MSDDEMDISLILAHLDGRLDDEQFAELERRLASEADLRAAYVNLAKLDAELRETGVTGRSEKVIPLAALTKASRLMLSRPKVWAIAAVFVASAIPGWFLLRQEPTPPRTVSTSTPAIAVITAQAGAVWNSPGLRQGLSLEPGILSLREGLAQIDFYSGASITLSGPAEIDLISRDAAVLHRGRLKAEVPPAARGFEIRTRDMLIEDLGTSFGLAIHDEEPSELIVFDGEVRATAADGKPVSIFGGDAVRLAKGERTLQAATSVTPFSDINDVIAGADVREESRYATWKTASLARRADPRLIAYYDFEELTNVSRRLVNRAESGLRSELDGGIVGARAAEGRWPQKTALDFRREGDRVRFQIPGDFDALTIYAWVRIDALDRYLNSLFLTDHFDPREIHWQLSSKGALHFATSPKGIEDLVKHNRRFYSETFWDPSKSGQWFFLATTADREAGTVVHYVNGSKVGFSGGTNTEKPLPKMRIGGADLGNWTEPITNHGIRTLNGRIDEFAIYQESLSESEIREIFELGKP